ncbi:MAG: CapA family protein, partial [Bacteroidota bacterium]
MDRAYFQRGRFVEAIAPLEEALRLDPNNRIAYLGLSQVLYQLDLPSLSNQYWQSYLALEPPKGEIPDYTPRPGNPRGEQKRELYAYVRGLQALRNGQPKAARRWFRALEAPKLKRIAARLLPDAVTIAAVGDILPRGGVPIRDPSILQALKKADLALGNLEAPLTRARRPTPGKKPAAIAAGRDFLLKAPPAGSETLRKLGLDWVALANNHMSDFRPAGIEDTLEGLKREGVQSSGAGSAEEAGKPAFFEKHGLRIACFSYSLVLPHGSIARKESWGIAPLPRDFARIRRRYCQKDDLVIVYLHWGEELSNRPTPSQRKLAHRLIDAGADLVLGSHPHVLQPFERYRGRLIAYSLGNFLFHSSPRIQSSR